MDFKKNLLKSVYNSYDKNIVESLSLEEAVFSLDKLQKVCTLYASLIGKRLSTKFYLLEKEEYTRPSGKGQGFRFISDDGMMIRFNLDERLKDNRFDFSSLDFWDKGNTDFSLPSRSISFGSQLNVVQILDDIISIFKTGKELKEDIEDEDSNTAENYLTESTIKVSDVKKIKKVGRLKFCKENSIPESYQTPSMLVKQIQKRNLESQWEDFFESEGKDFQIKIKKPEKETNTITKKIETAEKDFSKQVYADPETVFEDIENLLTLIAAGRWKSLVVCGQGGVGKTYHITEGNKSLKAILGEEGDKWTYHSGVKASPMSFYQTLFYDRNKIIVFDEADSFLKNPDIIMMLKPILDTSGKNYASYMYGTQNMKDASDAEIESYCRMVEMETSAGGGKVIGVKNNASTIMLPSKFRFTGSMVFISNMRANQIEQAIMSRSIFVDVYLASTDVIKRITSIIKAKHKDLTDGEINEIISALSGDSGEKEEPKAGKGITYMTPELARKNKELTVRAAELAIAMYKQGIPNWKRLAAMYA